MKNRVCIKVSIICLISSISAHSEPVPGQISDQILNILKPFQITQDIDKKSLNQLAKYSEPHSFDYKSLQEKITTFLKQKKPLKFLLVGFPFKSANTEKKVLGQVPDMAERRSLEYLNGCINSLKAIYPYGVELIIFCDGIPFCEFFGISTETVKLYEQGLQKLVQDLSGITLITSDVLQTKLALSSVQYICDVIDGYAPSDEEFHKQLEADPALQDGYKTLLGRLEIEFDSIKGKEFLAKHGPLSRIAKALMAREMRMRHFLESQFDTENFIRLTVHYSGDLGKKFGIKLSPNSFITPYHGVLVEEGDGNWFIRFRKDIDPQIFEEVSEVVNDLQCQYMRFKK
jgi:pyoverdine/dityrosine biosynthesis protein Dit1